jgi:hypothetical protein
MQAMAGDHLLVHNHHVGERDREAVILEVRGEDGAPPFVVRWSDTEQEALVFPGPDAEVRHTSQQD